MAEARNLRTRPRTKSGPGLSALKSLPYTRFNSPHIRNFHTTYSCMSSLRQRPSFLSSMCRNKLTLSSTYSVVTLCHKCQTAIHESSKHDITELNMNMHDTAKNKMMHVQVSLIQQVQFSYLTQMLKVSN